MIQKIRKAIFGSKDHPLKIGDIEIPCYVLDDGTRALSQRGLQGAIGMSMSGGTSGAHRMARFIEYLQKKASDNNMLTTRIERNLMSLFERINKPIIFKRLTGGNAYGYEATILPELCDFILECHNAGLLLNQQEAIAQAAKILQTAFAKIGIIALIDAATGYEKVRPREELALLLRAYISDELLPWAKRFPDSFYREMFRLRGWTYPYEAAIKGGSPKGPRYAGKLTNKLVYDKLPSGIAEELKRKLPHDEKWQRDAKLHQALTLDIGNPHLEKQVAIVTTLMKISPNWRKFEQHFKRAFPEAQGEMFEPDDDIDDKD